MYIDLFTIWAKNEIEINKNMHAQEYKRNLKNRGKQCSKSCNNTVCTIWNIILCEQIILNCVISNNRKTNFQHFIVVRTSLYQRMQQIEQHNNIF